MGQRISDRRYSPPSFDRSWGDKNRPGQVDPNYGRSPYVQQWNLNVQRQLPGKLVMDVGYLGMKATGLKNDSLVAINQLPVSALQQYGTKLNNIIRTAADAAQYGIALSVSRFQGIAGRSPASVSAGERNQHHPDLRYADRILDL